MKTLEEKLIDEFMNVRWDITLENAKEFVDIAEEFAIGFTDWCTKYRELNRNYKGEILYDLSKYDDVFLIEELLEIYKKEKGL